MAHCTNLDAVEKIPRAFRARLRRANFRVAHPFIISCTNVYMQCSLYTVQFAFLASVMVYGTWARANDGSFTPLEQWKVAVANGDKAALALFLCHFESKIILPKIICCGSLIATSISLSCAKL